jgi:hypothetical protein
VAERETIRVWMGGLDGYNELNDMEVDSLGSIESLDELFELEDVDFGMVRRVGHGLPGDYGIRPIHLARPGEQH